MVTSRGVCRGVVMTEEERKEDGRRKRKTRKRKASWQRSWSRMRSGARNALDWIKEGRLGGPYQAEFEIHLDDASFKLRRYHPMTEGEEPTHGPLLLIPPLMVTSEIYDISPELSAVALLLNQRMDVWLTDYGRPEEVEGGMERTLDEHVLAISRSVDHIEEVTGRAVHLVGYSQGGIFAYQAAAYRQSRGIASVVTFGSPVDIHRNLPNVKARLTEGFVRVARSAISGPLRELEGLPGTLTSRGFKMLNPAQEIKQLIGLMGLIHDRGALERQEPKRRFLGGEGFVAWPGPALRKFIDEVVVANRLKSGGLVINGRTTSLLQIDVPILYFFGERDDVARPAAVKAISKAAPNALNYGASISAGHFGLVVGSTAFEHTWPTVVAWVRGVDQGATPPVKMLKRDTVTSIPTRERTSDKAQQPQGLSHRLYDLSTDVVDGLWHRLGDASEEVSALMQSMRWQLPRLARIESLKDRSRVGFARALEEQAATIGHRTFFLWKGRAYTYAEANSQVNRVARALHDHGVRRGHHVGLLMGNGPDFLTAAGAVNRLGGIAVLLHAGLGGFSLEHALDVAEVDYLACDPEHLVRARKAFHGTDVLLLGDPSDCDMNGVVDLSAQARAGEPGLPAEIEPNPGRASDVALLMFTSGTTGLPKAAKITNRRWATGALGTAAACQLTPADTVYCCLPLHHSTGFIVAVGGALIGGTRLALAPRFSRESFWDDVRQNGVTVVFYVGELCRYLTQPSGKETVVKQHPVRLFAGNGMRPRVWRDLLAQVGPIQVIEFYGSTEGNVLLANLSGDKVGSVGRTVGALGGADVALVQYDLDEDTFVRDEDGRLVRTRPDEPGILLSPISEDYALSRFDGYTDGDATEQKVLRDVFQPGDAWFNTGDLMWCDEDGDYWFVDRIGDTYRWKGENVSTEEVAQSLLELDCAHDVAVYGIEIRGREGRAGMAAIELAHGYAFDGNAAYAAVTENLFPQARPRFIRIVDALERTASFKVRKGPLRIAGADPEVVQDPLFWLDEAGKTYAPLSVKQYKRLTGV
jgi:putative long chain acyl-CoA synthase